MIRKAFLTLSLFALSFILISAQAQASDVIKYKIKWGDTLSQIALDYQVSMQHLIQLNNIHNPDLIFEDDTLLIQNDQEDSEENEDAYSQNRTNQSEQSEDQNDNDTNDLNDSVAAESNESEMREEAYQSILLQSVTEKFRTYEFKY